MGIQNEVVCCVTDRMRFEEVSDNLESRILAVATAVFTWLCEECQIALGVIHASREQLKASVAAFDPRSAAAAVTQVAPPGGFVSVLLAMALILRLLHSALLQLRVARLLAGVDTLAGQSEETVRSKDD
jgi:hypothetical protein